ncbi:MAG TPA: signal peptide peptidase SppA [Sphingobacteriaceae bacterium]|nr:signal peptide peptidase SppA [Sphingobacteriaceae bacterium]
MKEFFKIAFASMVGVILSVIVLFIISLIFIGVIIGSASQDKKVNISANTVMHISLNYSINERTSKNPFQQLDFLGFKASKSLGLNDILASIKKASTDDNIDGIYLDLTGLQAGLATAEEIRNALIDFKKSGKFILAYSEVYTQGAYYLASVADKIYLNPEGLLEFKGFSSEITFYKGALDKLDIEAQIIKVGTYKSAVEPFILNKMSEPNRLQVNSFLGSMYSNFLGKISESRKIPKDSLFAIANDLKVQNAADAVKYKLADGLRYKDEILDELKSRTGIDKKKDVKSISIEEYSSDNNSTGNSANRIAVIYASGEITGGEGNDETIGSERISRAIRKARTDDKIKAVVLRVNSPGGSALASDVIWREVILTKKVKPFIVSMGDVAASGGYYIACAADSIFAQPNTITGSIGVFGIIPNMKNFFNNKLGVTFDGVKTGKFSDLGSITRPLTSSETLIIQREVNRIYGSFVKKVSDGRKKSRAYVDSIGQGRVWSGTQALQNGLVDKLGNIDNAIHSAAKMAKLEEYKVVSYPTQKEPLESLFGNTADQLKDYFTKLQLGDQYTYYSQLKSALSFTGIQARLPYTISIK